MIEDFIEKFTNLTRPSVNCIIEKENIVIEVKSKRFEISRGKLEEYLTEVNSLKCETEDIILDSHNYEIMIDFTTLHFEESVEFHDQRNNINYVIGPPSITFLLFLITRLNTLGRNAARRMGITFFGRSFENRLENCESFEDLISILFRNVDTLRITSIEKMQLDNFKELADALTFEMAYNTGTSCIQIKHLEEFLTNTTVKNRRNSIQDCEAPKRLYNADLIYHYQLGQSIIHPALKFISYYHVLEHYFNIVYTEKMIEKIRGLITKPSFSPKRDTDIEKVIKEVKNNLKLESESNNAKNEIEALKLVIIQFIDLESLHNSLKELDPELISYYSNQIVEFSQGTNINFDDPKSLPGKLANRIYKTRNAVIHSKAYEKERYIPFEHESQLIREIPLIQFLAEEIILNTSKVL